MSSARCALLLRGVNVGGHKKVPMAGLRAWIAELGYEGVVSHLQSGNVVLELGRDSPDAVASRVERDLERRLGGNIRVLSRGHADLERIAAANPFRAIADNPSRMVLVFLSGPPAPARVETIDPADHPSDRFRIIGSEIYHWCPQGQAATKLTLDLWERRLGVVGTARNWNTLTRLVELTAA